MPEDKYVINQLEFDLPYWTKDGWRDRRYSVFEGRFWEQNPDTGKFKRSLDGKKAVCLRYGRNDWESKKTIYFSPKDFLKFLDGLQKWVKDHLPVED